MKKDSGGGWGQIPCGAVGETESEMAMGSRAGPHGPLCLDSHCDPSP